MLMEPIILKHVTIRVKNVSVEEGLGAVFGGGGGLRDMVRGVQGVGVGGLRGRCGGGVLGM